VGFIRTRPGKPGRDGRRLPEDVPSSAFITQADTAILATGQFPETGWIEAPLREALVAPDGWLASGTAHETGHPKVFVAGDFALGATTLIEAIGHAKACARRVEESFSGIRPKRLASVGPAFRSHGQPEKGTGRSPDLNLVPLHRMPTLAVAERRGGAEVEAGFDRETARREASRCYLCHYKFEILDAKCVLCDECLKVKPVEGCIVEVADLLRDEEGRITGYRRVEAGRTDSLYYNRLWIDQSQCVRCGRCEAVCPVDAISIQKVSFASA
jgi:formate dehydrogenase major subunit